MSPPGRIIIGFAVVIGVGTILLMLPAATTAPGGIDALSALFTTTSAFSVTGLVVLDTGRDFTLFGQLVILALIQIGGLGVMVFTMLLGMLVARRTGLQLRQTVAAETKSEDFGGLRAVVLRILAFSLTTEAVVACLLSVRFATRYSDTTGEGVYAGIFHAVSAFNNAGFGLQSDSIMPYASDPWINLPICAAVIIGGMGFPVLTELVRRYRLPMRWSMTTRIVVCLTPLLLLAGTAFILVQEWSNAATMGELTGGQKVLAAFFQSTIARTAGFNSIDIAQMHPVSWFGLDILMFIGGGPAGTAGGVKLTTVAVLAAMTCAEITGRRTVALFGRRVSRFVHRQATTVIVLALTLIVSATMAIMLMEPSFAFDQVLFEVVSAFATVGLSTGITADLPGGAQGVLIFVMATGRIGPVMLASALALRQHREHHELPKERPLIG
ncbi:TrkH family potassium uptake protein [Brevibacterium gallinarum]|uniref:TrkH family potassium uptake protein n=1 Tax=Brevibacterium gallinarum TaxID=2762220 RepID=A0ABR8WUC2_9MICO|nr:potassium transporter TrkG [Brevibacterium gallinarum]MBD8020663.1 TrkH family potassium uptake protein [Brevibacterium gallinarum]